MNNANNELWKFTNIILRKFTRAQFLKVRHVINFGRFCHFSGKSIITNSLVIFGTLSGVKFGQFCILALIQVLIADNFGIFSIF